MRGDEAISRAVSDSLWGTASDPITGPELPPGIAFDPTDIDTSAKLATANSLLDEAATLTGDIAGEIGATVDSLISDAGRDAAYLQGDMLGYAGNLLDSAGQTVAKLQSDLLNRPRNLIADSYGFRAAMGGDIPTAEEVYVSNYSQSVSAYDKGLYPGAKPPNPLTKPIGGDTEGTLPPDTTGEGPATTGAIPETPTYPTTEPPPQQIETPPVEPTTTTQPPPTGAIQPQPTGEIGNGDYNFPSGEGTGQIGDQVITRPITDPNNVRCPPGYSVIGIEGGFVTCYLTEPPPEAIEPPPQEQPPDWEEITPPTDGTTPPVLPPVTIPEGPAPVIDPVTGRCTYNLSGYTLVACKSVPPPPPPPKKYWLVTRCNGCDYQVCIYEGYEQPEVGPGELIAGPFDMMPNPQSHVYLNCQTDVSTGEPSETEEGEGPTEEEETPEEEEEEGEEEEGEEQPESPIRPAPRPGPAPDDYCNYITAFSQDANEVFPSSGVVIGVAPAETALGRLVQSAFRNQLMLVLSIFPETFKSVTKWGRGVIEKAFSGTHCDRERMLPVAIVLGLANVVQRWLGFMPKQTMSTLDQASNTLCQHVIPGPKETDAAYLRGDIDKPTWECWHKANGDYIKPAERVMESQRAKLDPTQLDWLYRRKLITQVEYDKLMREAGVLFDEDKRNIHRFNQVFPSLSDNVRLMNRDVSDEVNIDWSKSDNEFKAKYRGKIKDWFDALGITEEVAKYFWRAHWHIPSFTMLTEMLHRLQPDMAPPELQTTIADVRQALMQDDWHPNWIDRLIAISYKAVTKTDAVRAYMIYASDDDKLDKQLRAVGYKAEDAAFYVQYYKKNREIQDRRRSGYPLMRTITNQYARCEMTESQYRETIGKLVLSDAQEKSALEAAFVARDVRQRQQAIRAVRRPYTLGIFDDGEAAQSLAEAGVDPVCVDSLLNNWRLDRLRRDKYLTASQLCQMRERGIIDAATQQISLVRSGWRREDAILIVANCGAILSEKAARKADTMARRAAADAKKAQKEAERIRRLAECGPPPCPRRPGANKAPSVVSPQNPGQTSADTGSNTRPAQ